MSPHFTRSVEKSFLRVGKLEYLNNFSKIQSLYMGVHPLVAHFFQAQCYAWCFYNKIILVQPSMNALGKISLRLSSGFSDSPCCKRQRKTCHVKIFFRLIFSRYHVIFNCNICQYMSVPLQFLETIHLCRRDALHICIFSRFDSPPQFYRQAQPLYGQSPTSDIFRQYHPNEIRDRHKNRLVKESLQETLS